MSSNEFSISLRNVNVFQAKHLVLSNVNLDLEKGEFAYIIAVSYTHLTLPTSDLV